MKTSVSEFAPALYVVGTPIGNLQDITLRAIEVLRAATVVYAEDTRVTRTLLQQYESKAVLRSCREAMPAAALQRVADAVVTELQAGHAVAFVTDAGTPGISDPGGALVAAVLERGGAVVPIPGVSALTTLVSVGGLPIYRPLFVGFLPKKKGHQTLMGKLQAALTNDTADALVLFESPHRIVPLLEALAAWPLPLTCVLGRELTKKFEEVLRGDPQTLATNLAARQAIKGEVTLLVSVAKRLNLRD